MIDVKQVSKIYHTGGCEVYALNQVSLTIQSGELCAIVGQSGSGKSTLMNMLGCLDVPTSGEYFLNNERVSSLNLNQLSEIRNRQIGFVFQGFHLLSRMTALENVELPLIYAKIPRELRRQLAIAALTRVGLAPRMYHRPSEMSGGQQQRVAIARAIVTNPSIILADEPTGNLDKRSGEDILNLLCELNREGTTILLITHDVSIASHAPRAIQIADGKIISDTAS